MTAEQPQPAEPLNAAAWFSGLSTPLKRMVRRLATAHAAAGAPPGCPCGVSFTSWRARREHMRKEHP